MLVSLPFVTSMTHEVAWEPGPVGSLHLVQRSTTDQFVDNVVESGWVEGESWTSEGLEHLQQYFFRVKVQLEDGQQSEFSPAQTTTVDLASPTAEVAPLGVSQTSLLFLIDGQISDDGSGPASFRLQYLPPEGQWADVGVFEEFPVTFQATLPGEHAFKAMATDLAGNVQSESETVIRTTIVPEPIIITDLTGEEFDITNAVLRYNISVNGFAHGLGRYRILPIIEPDFFNPGDVGYPDAENLADVMAVSFGGEKRAYPIGELANREVVDDVVAGVHLAATY